MNLLIVSATEMEIEELLIHLKGSYRKNNFPASKFRFPKRDLPYFFSFKKNKLTVDVLITGVGMMNTAFYMSRLLAVKKYALALNAGIAGSFSNKIFIGDVVQVKNEMIADLGAEDKHKFLDLSDLKLPQYDTGIYKKNKLSNPHNFEFQSLKKLKKVSGISVNKVHGNKESINMVKEKYKPDAESMEGAAFFYACLMEKIPFLEIRAISNYVEQRDKTKWNIPLAIENLNKWMSQLLNEILSLRS